MSVFNAEWFKAERTAGTAPTLSPDSSPYLLYLIGGTFPGQDASEDNDSMCEQSTHDYQLQVTDDGVYKFDQETGDTWMKTPFSRRDGEGKYIETVYFWQKILDAQPVNPTVRPKAETKKEEPKAETKKEEPYVWKWTLPMGYSYPFTYSINWSASK